MEDKQLQRSIRMGPQAAHNSVKPFYHTNMLYFLLDLKNPGGITLPSVYVPAVFVKRNFSFGQSRSETQTSTHRRIVGRLWHQGSIGAATGAADRNDILARKHGASAAMKVSSTATWIPCPKTRRVSAIRRAG
jgi:hypothetical protein